MEILKISDNSLKVMLNAEDMNAYSLDCDLIEYNRPYSVAVLREILRDAGDMCGLDSSGAKFFVQLYASATGECEIFARRIEESATAVPDYKWNVKEYSIIPAKSSRGIYVYSFDSMGPLLESCNRLCTAGYSGESNAYRDEGIIRFYLVLEERSPLPEEHGGKLCTKNTAYYINEHCKLICEGAVELLGRLA